MLYKTTSKHVIQKLRAQFSRHGVPSKVISDNGPQFSSSLATHVKKEMTVRKNKQKQYYDRNTKSLNDLEKGDIVRNRPQGRDNEWKKGIIEEKVNIKSYNVKTEDGGIYRRNRRHLRSSKEQFELNDPNVE